MSVQYELSTFPLFLQVVNWCYGLQSVRGRHLGRRRGNSRWPAEGLQSWADRQRLGGRALDRLKTRDSEHWYQAQKWPVVMFCVLQALLARWTRVWQGTPTVSIGNVTDCSVTDFVSPAVICQQQASPLTTSLPNLQRRISPITLDRLIYKTSTH